MKTTAKTILKCLLPVALSVAVGAFGPASVRGAKADSVCVHFSGTAEGEFIELSGRSTLGGSLPLTLCDLEPGASYRLTVKGPGFERRIGSLSTDGSGVPAVRGIQLSVVSRNIVLPGWGSAYAGRIEVGAGDAPGLAVSLIVLGQEELEYRHMRSRLEVLQGRIDEALTYADKARFQAAAHETSREINIQNSHCERLCRRISRHRRPEWEKLLLFGLGGQRE